MKSLIDLPQFECLRNYSKTALKVGVILQSPYSYSDFFERDKRKYPRSGPIPQYGYAIDVTSHICQMLKVPCQFILVNHTDFGHRINGTWYGLLRQLQDNEFDTTIPVYSYDEQRVEDFDWPGAVLSYERMLITRQAGLKDTDFHTLLVFSEVVWLLLLATAAIIALLASVPSLNVHTALQAAACYFERMLTVSCIFTSNTVAPIPLPCYSSKIALIVWFLAIVVFSGAYTGSLIERMVKRHVEPPFWDYDSLAQCVMNKQCRLIDFTLSQSFYSTLLRTNENYVDSHLLLLRRAVLGGNPVVLRQNISTVFDEILSDKSVFNVFIGSKEEYLAIVESNDCSYEKIFVETKERSFMVRKEDQCLANAIRRAVAELVELGLVQKYMQDYDKSRSCLTNSQQSAQSLPVQAIAGLFYILLVGIGVGLLALILECLRNFPRSLFKSL